MNLTYTPVASGIPAVYNYTSTPKYDSSIIQKNECVNIYARWCGDGIVSNGETCDDGAQNGQPGKCGVTCGGTTTTQTGGLSVKKYVSTGTTLSNDAQTLASALELPRGSLFNYIVVVVNSGTTAIASGAKVTDTLPSGVTISGAINASGWTCTTSGNTAFTCLYPNTIATGATLPQIVIPAYLDMTVPVGTPIKNVAAVCELSGATLDCTTVPGDCSPSDPNYNPVTNKCDPAVINVVPSIDLSIKKYVKGDDVFAPILTNEDFNYNIVVQNNGAFSTGTTSDSTSGTTTVTDTLPSYITLRGTPSGNGWTCTGASGGNSFSCTTQAVVAPHNLFEVITVPVRATNAVFQPNGIINTATVSNPYDKYLANNSDSAAVNPPNPNGFDLMIHKYVNGDDEGIGAQSGNTLTYTFVVENLGMLAVTGTTTVTDTDFPAGITLSGVTGSGWTCTNTSTGFSCNRSDSIVMGARFPDILVQARIVGQPGVYRNIVCLSNPGDPNEGAILDPALGLYKVNNCNPADVVITPSDRFDLMIKKRVGYGLDSSLRDRNTGRYGNEEQDALVVSQGGNMLYAYTVTNLGAVTATGTTVVEDTLPNDVTISGSVYAPSPWTCAITGNGNRSFRCTTTSTLSVGQSFSDIRVNAVASTAIPAGVYTNIVTLSNS